MFKFTFLSVITVFLLLFGQAFSQTTLYTQNFGVSPSSGFPAGWSSSSGSATWTISSSVPSTGYTGASGGLYVSSTGPTAAAHDTLTLSGVSTVGYSNISVMWGERRVYSQSSSPVVQWSADGITWNNILFIDVMNNSVWGLVNGGVRLVLTSGAEGVSNLRFRWIGTVSFAQSTISIDDFDVQGASSAPPSKISIISVNGGTNPDSCHSFNVIVQTLDTNGAQVNVQNSSIVNLTVFTGTGILSGGVDTIQAGQGSCTFTVTYSNTGTGVSFLATCGSLTSDTSDTFTVRPCGYCSSNIIYNGQTYTTILIGTQCWMQQNLNVGTMINYISDGDQTDNSVIEKYCYSNVASNCVSYGGLYQWAEMVQYYGGVTNTTTFSPPLTGNLQGICPPTWHLPSTSEWTTLQNYLGAGAGAEMRETGMNYWNYNSSSVATNSSGFSARGGGSCSISASYGRNVEANFWSVNDFTSQPNYADYVMLANNSSLMNLLTGSNGAAKNYGLSVRCIFDYPASGISKTVLNTNEFVSIYPNPASTYLNLKFQTLNINNAEIKIYDLSGRLVYDEIYNCQGIKKIKTIDISTFETGNYILQVNYGKNRFNKKLVIMR